MYVKENLEVRVDNLIEKGRSDRYKSTGDQCFIIYALGRCYRQTGSKETTLLSEEFPRRPYDWRRSSVGGKDE